MIVTVTPADLRPGDRVLLNGGWWLFVDGHPSRIGRRLIVEHDHDVIDVYRRDTDLLTVDRAEP